MSHSKTLPSSVDRRRFLHHAWSGVAASLSLALLPADELFGSHRFGDNPFTLGVPSCDPTSDAIALWRRLAREPANPARPADPRFRRLAWRATARCGRPRGGRWRPRFRAFRAHVE